MSASAPLGVQGLPLTAADLANFARCGIPPAMLERAGVFRVDSVEGARELSGAGRDQAITRVSSFRISGPARITRSNTGCAAITRTSRLRLTEAGKSATSICLHRGAVRACISSAGYYR
jgi:hypothetical protein